MRSAPSSRRERALPEIVVLGPAKPNFLGWTGSSNASLFDSKGKSCQLPGFKPAVLLLSMKSARQDAVMRRQSGIKEGKHSAPKAPR